MFVCVLVHDRPFRQSANNKEPLGMMWENHRVVACTPIFHISHHIEALISSPLPPLFTSLGKEDTAERIKSNQCTSGMLHKPYVCTAVTISPITGWFTSLWFYFFIVITLISYHNAPEHVLCRCWWILVQGGVIRWSGRVRWNGKVLRKLSVTLATCPRRQSRGCIALGSQLCWARCEPALSWAHYLYQFALTIGTLVSRQCFRRQITHKQITLAPLLVCKYMHNLLDVFLPFASCRDKTTTDAFVHYHTDQSDAD